ncbi:MAG: hypothetical protein BJ554DRAFT_5663 [Olpidium bornovanus]|uniref:GST C-terminal domain-containing protein n=1 Tax=Olpidium bornovanus TaxID=278681 RepID=A0A8H8DKV2_9FUNG|nr:MAG: hypothetical protein BJ554DRAFT_5663 [Olpidium bornovanus]
MTISYDKWNTLDEYTSSGSDSDAGRGGGGPAASRRSGKRQRTKRTRRRLPPGFGSALAGRKPVKFVTVPWDPASEKVRWALDRHSVAYVEHAWPWGLHLAATLPYSDPPPSRQVTWTPIMEIEDGEVFKRNTTDMMLWLYSRSLCANERMYAPDSAALELEQFLDEHLAPAARVIFYHVVLSDPCLVRECLFDVIHLDTHKSLFRLAWPLLRIALIRHFGLGNKSAIEEAWEAVERSFAKVEEALHAAGGAGYLCGNSFTAADLTFGAYAEFVLFPNQTDHVTTSETIPVAFPATSRLPPDVCEKVVRLRRSAAGKYAFQLYRSDRDICTTGSRPSRYEKSARPWWSRCELLRNAVYGSVAAASASAALLFAICGPLLASVIIALACAAFALYASRSPRFETIRRRAGQLRFLIFGKWEAKPDPPADPKPPPETPSKDTAASGVDPPDVPREGSESKGAPQLPPADQA